MCESVIKINDKYFFILVFIKIINYYFWYVINKMFFVYYSIM